jgi:hypothetical protein
MLLIDVRDGRYAHPETAGIDAALSGWLQTSFPDQELEAHGPSLRSLSVLEVKRLSRAWRAG